MKKYLFGVAVIILCVACAVWIKKGCAREVPMDAITPTTDERQPIGHPHQRPLLSNMSNTVVVSNGVIVVDTREKIPPEDPYYNDYLQELRRVAEKGADSRFTIHVVDQDGKEVVDAEVDVLFPFNGRQGNTISGKTDAHGLFPVEDRTTGEPSFTVTKKGYYRTSSKFGVFKIGTRCLQNGRWLPWDPTFEVTLKEIRKPIPMIAKRAKIKIPKKNQPFGFDLEVGDLVEPYGKGKYSDIMLKSFGDKPFPLTYNYSETLVIQSNNSLGGFIRKKKDDWCALLSDCEASEKGYIPEFTFSTNSKEGQPAIKDNVREEEYLIYKTRVITDENGNIKSAHYGKIYGPLTHGINSNDREGAGARILYYFNPTPNDRNLEFDGKNNLLEGLSSLEEVHTP